MDLDNIIERTMINFPEPISPQETEGLFRYLRKEGSLVVDYAVTTHKSIGSRFHSSQPEELVQLRDVKIEGGVSSSEGRFNTAYFRCNNSYTEDEQIKMVNLAFFTTPGYTVRELLEEEPGQIELIDSVRALTEKYFKERNSPSSRAQREMIGE